MERQGTPLDATKKFAMDGAFLAQVARAENVQIEPGDIVLLRTGWLAWYKSLDEAGLAAMAADNVALEALPVEAQVGFQHRRLIALQGMPIGEVWDLDELAQDCARDRVYECMLMSAPLYLPGGVGSPANAYAMK